jgi:hypothetical protein
MLGQKKNRSLYYLLPGMNRANRIRRRQILRWAILVGIVCAALFGLFLYWMNMPHVKYNW